MQPQDVKISGLPPESAATVDDLLAIVDMATGVTKKVALSVLAAAIHSTIVPPGTIIDFSSDTLPNGWLLCHGQAINRTTYAALFAAIGTLYGVGDGATTFNVPDLRGRVIAGQDDMGGTSANRLTGVTAGTLDGDILGSAGGAEAVTLATTQVPNASGSMGLHGGENGSMFINRSGIVTGGAVGANYRAPGTATGGSQSLYTTIDFSLGFGGGAHNNVQPTMIMNKLIKT